MKELIVTADDFGAALEVNEAVELAHSAGILTATSLMVTGPAAADAVERAHRVPSLRVGLHLVLVEGRPASPPTSIPNLIRSDGRLRTDMVKLGAELFIRPRIRRQVAEEITAQFEAFRATGLKLDHVNVHKHYHLHPTVSKLIVEIGSRFGMRAIRVPVEPRTILSVAEPGTGSSIDVFLRPWLKILKTRCERAGLLTPQYVFGLAWSGAMSARRLSSLLRCLPHGLSEIYLHPATSDQFAGAAPGYRYAEEFAALISPNVLDAAKRTRVRRGGFADFGPVGAAT